jgi:hypothetical protein
LPSRSFSRRSEKGFFIGSDTRSQQYQRHVTRETEYPIHKVDQGQRQCPSWCTSCLSKLTLMASERGAGVRSVMATIVMLRRPSRATRSTWRWIHRIFCFSISIFQSRSACCGSIVETAICGNMTIELFLAPGQREARKAMIKFRKAYCPLPAT